MVDSQVYSKILLQQQDEFDEKRFGLRFKDYIDGVSSEGKGDLRIETQFWKKTQIFNFLKKKLIFKKTTQFLFSRPS